MSSNWFSPDVTVGVQPKFMLSKSFNSGMAFVYFWSSVRVTVGFLVTLLTMALLSQLLTEFDWAASSRKRPSGSSSISFQLLLFHGNGDHCASGDIQCFRNGFTQLPRFEPQNNLIAETCREILSLHGLFYLTCPVTLYTKLCAFLHHGQPLEFATGGLQSCFRDWSR